MTSMNSAKKPIARHAGLRRDLLLSQPADFQRHVFMKDAFLSTTILYLLYFLLSVDRALRIKHHIYMLGCKIIS